MITAHLAQVQPVPVDRFLDVLREGLKDIRFIQIAGDDRVRVENTRTKRHVVCSFQVLGNRLENIVLLLQAVLKTEEK